MNRRVVITGIGAISPLGDTVAENWTNFSNGVSGASVYPDPLLDDYYIKIAAYIQNLPDTSHYLSKKVRRRFERFIILGAIAAHEAIASAGIDLNKADIDPFRYGCIIGNGGGGIKSHYDQAVLIHEKNHRMVSPFYVTNVISSMVSAYVAQQYNLKGPSFGISSACASSNHSIATACTYIQNGSVDMMISGGAESILSSLGIVAFGQLNALSSRNDNPQTASRPFDKNRDGFVMSEGAGIVCLEEYEHAKKRGAHIYGEITGFGVTSDAYDIVAPLPDGGASARSMINALNLAQLNASDIDLINAHATSTQMGDAIEAKAIFCAFGHEIGRHVLVHSTKSMVGHLIGAAGGLEVMAALLAINKNIVHPSINITELDTDLQLNVVQETRERPVSHVLSNSFGFGGQNACIIISKLQ